MLYGSNKRRSMVRSLLPSTARKGARENLETIRRHARRSTRQSLAALTHLDVDDFDDVEVDFTSYPNHDIRYAVLDRRGADKTAPFLRWAAATTAHLPRDERLTALGAMLPDGMIGDHAMSHARWHDDLAGTDHPRFNYWHSYKRSPDRTYDWVTAYGLELLERGQLNHYNIRLRDHALVPLRGVDGLHEFARRNDPGALIACIDLGPLWRNPRRLSDHAEKLLADHRHNVAIRTGVEGAAEAGFVPEPTNIYRPRSVYRPPYFG